MSAPLVAGGVSALKMIKEYNSQEILWGDLIHSADFAAAYDITERPAELDLLAIEVCDTLNGGDGDGLIDAGETIAFYPTLRTTWGEAKNVKLSIISTGIEYEDASLYDVLTQEVDFGQSLSAYAQAKSVNPIIVKFKEGIADRRIIQLNFQAIADNCPQPLSVEYKVRVNNVVKLQGMITKDMTLTADKNYRVVKDVAIPEGVTLKIEPGTKVVFDNGTALSSVGNLYAHGKLGEMIEFTCNNGFWNGINTKDTISYCLYDFCNGTYSPKMENSIIRFGTERYNDTYHYRTTFTDNIFLLFSTDYHHFYFDNFINNDITTRLGIQRLSYISYYKDFIQNANIFNLNSSYLNSKPGGVSVLLGKQSDVPETIEVDSIIYLGSSKEKLIRPLIYEISNNLGWSQSTFAYHDLTNLRKTPIREAHGIVWKVVVDGYDAQDEYDELPPLGVGKHKFEVYFNRPMNVAKAPTVAFGVRSPYTQNGVNEEGS